VKNIPYKIPTGWSYSSYSIWSGCPHRYLLEKVMRLRTPSSPQMVRGETIHKYAENFVKGLIRGIPKDLRRFETEFKTLRKAKAKAEAPWGISPEWKPVDFHAGWLRLKLDASLSDAKGHDIHVIDYKTGRVYDTHETQSDIYAASTLPYFPKLRTVNVEFWYLDHGHLGQSPFKYTLKEVQALQKDWTKKALKMLGDRRFRPTPSKETCKWCPHRADKGGKCDAYWKE